MQTNRIFVSALVTNINYHYISNTIRNILEMIITWYSMYTQCYRVRHNICLLTAVIECLKGCVSFNPKSNVEQTLGKAWALQ